MHFPRSVVLGFVVAAAGCISTKPLVVEPGLNLYAAKCPVRCVRPSET